MDFSYTPATLLITASALGALLLALIIVPSATRGARMRAAEKARAWAELKRPDWEARAARKREARASGEQTQARTRRALLIAVAAVALGATNLSAHGTITAMARVGLHSLDTAISVIVVFEMFLAILCALSYWHMHHGTGFNRYELGVWLMAALMGGIAWWGAGNVVFALWPLLAAIAWHLVVTFGRESKQSAFVRWLRLKLGRATTRDATSLDTERRISRIVHCAFMANEGPRALRALYERAFNRAWARADELGVLTPEVRARIQTRLAARYAGARALAPEAVAHMNPWSAHAPNARTTRAARTVSAPAIDSSAHEGDDARARNDERAQQSAPKSTARAHGSDAVLGAIAEHFDGPAAGVEWVQDFFRKNGELPNRNQLAIAFKRSPGNCGKWMTPIRKALSES